MSLITNRVESNQKQISELKTYQNFEDLEGQTPNLSLNSKDSHDESFEKMNQNTS